MLEGKTPDIGLYLLNYVFKQILNARIISATFMLERKTPVSKDALNIAVKGIVMGFMTVLITFMLM